MPSAPRPRSVPSLLAAGLVMLLAALPGCSKKRGPAGPAGAAAPSDTRQPEAPLNLRLEQHPAGAPQYLLRWDQPTGVVPVRAHVVYASTATMPAPDASQAIAATGSQVDFAEVTLPGDTGLRHLRVSAISASGIEGRPSPEYVVDTTARALFLGQPPGDGSVASDLFAMLPADPRETNLTAGSQTILDFRASPDGRRVAFRADRTISGLFDLYVTGIDGSAAPVKISGSLQGNGGVRSGWSWSPAGDRLAFAADAETAGVIEAFVVPVDGNGRTRVSGTMVTGGGIDADATAVKWSPRGRHVAYLARQRDAQVQEAFVAPADASQAPVAVSGDLLAGSSVQSCDWSPDGRWLAFNGQRGSTLMQLFVAPPDGAAAPAVRSGTVVPSNDVFDFAWSPDSTRLAFRSLRNLGRQVYVTRAATAVEPVPLDAGFPTSGVLGQYAWSPDGTHIAFIASRDSESANDLYSGAATGGAFAVRITGNLIGGGNVLSFAWSPDGAQIGFIADKIVNNRFELYTTVPGFGSEPFRVSGALPLGPGVTAFDWSSEGDRLAFIGFLQSTELFAVDRSGNRAPQPLPSSITANGAIAFPHLGRR